MWGTEFFIEKEQADFFLSLSDSNSDIVKPAMGGIDINNSPSIASKRWAINFGEMSQEEAGQYPEVFEYIKSKLKEKRSNLDPVKYSRVVNEWWKYFHSRNELYARITQLNLYKVLARSRVSDFHMVAFVNAQTIFIDTLVVFLHDTFSAFAVLQSSIHDIWSRTYASTMKTDVRYIVTDCFETFPFPEPMDNLEEIGNHYYRHRHSIMQKSQKGLTKTYNSFHDSKELLNDIRKLRDIHVEMDNAVASTYGWGDLNFGHGFYETKQGVRFTISEEARREVLQRLLKLNHERYEEEVRQGLHNKKKKASTSRKKKSVSSVSDDEQLGLFS